MATKEKCVYITSFDPKRLLQLFSEDEYEEIIEEWQREYLGKKYSRVERLGGPKDKGRDIICTDNEGYSYIYQCKHYDRKLRVHEVLLEIGKCCYYCCNGDYKTPKEYYFVSPHGVTVTARDLLMNPVKLKTELKERWEKLCRKKISSSKTIELKGNLLIFIDKFDFSIFDYVTPSEFIDEFKKTPYYTSRFGDLRKPKKIVKAPDEIRYYELVYITKIFDAYSEYLGKNIEDVTNLKKTDPKLLDDFNRQREYFYNAEYLAAYSREIFAPEFQWFEKLTEEIYHGIIDEIEEDAKNGFARLRKVLKLVCGLIVCPSNPLSKCVNIKERKGICHHLANERDDVKWRK